MKKKDIKKLTIDQEKKYLEKNKKDLFNLRFQKANGQLTNTSKVNETKKIIARLKTNLRGKGNA